jgi:hypothetical protein
MGIYPAPVCPFQETADMKKPKNTKPGKRLPPVRIPLSFDDAVGGLLAVKPKKKAPAKKKG